MKQIVDKLNKIAKKIDESVEIPQTDLIIDSLDAITKAYGGTPNDSNLIVDKLEDIYNNIGTAPAGNIEITENGENINVAPYATATVNVSGGGSNMRVCHITAINPTEYSSSVPFANAKPIYNDAYINDNMPIVASESTLTFDCIISYEEYELGYFVGFFNNEDNWTLTDLVNCSIDENYLVSITDPTQDCSFTATYNGE